MHVAVSEFAILLQLGEAIYQGAQGGGYHLAAVRVGYHRGGGRGTGANGEAVEERTCATGNREASSCGHSFLQRGTEAVGAFAAVTSGGAVFCSSLPSVTPRGVFLRLG